MPDATSPLAAGMVIAIGQLRMHWTIEANMAEMLGAIEFAHGQGATLCAFAELAITGFHRQIVALAKPELIAPEVARLQALCAKLTMAVTVGAPTFADDGARYNSHLFINERGELAGEVSKIGLTEPEASFFRPGTHRPVATLQGQRCTAVICREIEDHAAICEQLPRGSVDIVLWPGQMRPDPDKPVADPPAHVQDAQRLAADLNAYVVQTNWPNALNRPEESEHTGNSAVIAPDGELLFRLPEQASGLGIFTLGARSFVWHPRH